MAALVKRIVRITSQKMGIKMPCKTVQCVKVPAAKTEDSSVVTWKKMASYGSGTIRRCGLVGVGVALGDSVSLWGRL